MTQVFKDDGTRVPVTRVKAGPCVVTQVKTEDTDDYSAVQIGFEEQKKHRLNKAQKGHLTDLNPVKIIREFRTDDVNHDLERGDEFDLNIFSSGDKINVTGETKGKGFQGVVKRHDFAGAPASHGTKDQLRMPGSAGQTGPSRVFKGKKMPGRMGGGTTTIQNLEIVEVDDDAGELLIKGGLPGAKDNLLRIYTEEGDMETLSSDSEEQKDQESEQDSDSETKEDK